MIALSIAAFQPLDAKMDGLILPADTIAELDDVAAQAGVETVARV